MNLIAQQQILVKWRMDEYKAFLLQMHSGKFHRLVFGPQSTIKFCSLYTKSQDNQKSNLTKCIHSLRAFSNLARKGFDIRS